MGMERILPMFFSGWVLRKMEMDRSLMVIYGMNEMAGNGGLSYLLYVCKQVNGVRVCWVSLRSADLLLIFT